MIRELLETLDKTQREHEGLQQRFDLLLRKLFGPKAERFDPSQPLLFPEMNDAESESTTDSTTIDTPVSSEPTEPDQADSSKKKPSGHGRKKLPSNLRRERVVHELSEVERQCSCCGGLREKFGEDTSEQLDYVPASLFVKVHVRCKYACKKCQEGVAVAAKPPQFVEKGLPGPGLIAQIIASKYWDHLPLYRLERIFARHGVELARSTRCSWVRHAAEMLQPISDLMMSLVLQSRALHVDATSMPFQNLDIPGKVSSGLLWAYVGDRDHPFHVFDFCDDHSGKRIRELLDSYRGFLNADAHSVYDSLFAKPGRPIVEVGCWAHARRYFFDAKGNDVHRAHEMLARIRNLYAIEVEAKKFVASKNLTGPEADAEFLRLRREKSTPAVTAIDQWLERERNAVLPKSLIGQAIQYASNHWQALTRFLQHGFLAIDNNVAENALRAIALGRKNWLFAGNDRGARTAATLFSLTSTCHRLGIDCFAYLRDAIDRLTRHPDADAETLRALLPDRWSPPTPPPESLPA